MEKFGVALVSYSSSSDEESGHNLESDYSEKRPLSWESDSELDQPKEKKICKKGNVERFVGDNKDGLLPVPNTVALMYDLVGDEVSDNPDKHGGRVRTFQHQRGNWASYVFAAVTRDERISELTDSMIKCLGPHGTFTASDDLHLSLSRTFVIRHHWIQPLLQSLRERLRNCSRCKCALSDINIYTNDEKTRTFIGVKTDASGDSLQEYIKKIDCSLQEFKLPVYYKEPSFHVSVLWTVGNLEEVITRETKDKLQNILYEFLEECPDLSVFSVERLLFKTGNQVHPIELDQSR